MSVSQIKVTQKLLLNTNNSKPNDRLIVKQGCVGTVYIESKINDKGGIMEYPSGTTAAIRMLSNGKSQILDDCDPIVNNNTITFPVSQKMQDDPGDALCEIILIYGGTSFTTVTFPITIEANVHNDSNIKGAPEYTTLINALVRVEAAEQIANTAYEVATEAQTILVHTQSEEIEREASEVIRVSNETSRNSAESARVIAENARNSNETGRTTAETSRASAEASRATEESKRVTAESGRTTAESSRASAESGRTTAEQNRSTAENSRILAESNRVTEYNAMITNGYIVPKAPVATFAALATTYTSPVKGWTSKVLADGKVYRYDGTVWSWIDTITASSYDALLTTFTAQLAEKATKGQIVASDLKILNESDRLGLANLREEVIQAIAGTTPVNSIPADKSVTPKKVSFINSGKNKFDKSKATSGYFISGSSGNQVANVDFYASEYIAVLPNTIYTLNNMGQFAYYTSAKVFISGYAKPSSAGAYTFTTPANCAYIRASIYKDYINTAQLELGSTATSYEVYYNVIDKEVLPIDIVYKKQLDDAIKEPIVKTVKKDGTGDFWQFSQAVLSITDASKTKPYIIEVYTGIYDIMSEIYASLPTIQGLVIPDYVTVRGVGIVELKGILSDNSPMADVENISTINIKRNANLENIAVTAKNLRYAVHDESSNTYQDWERNVNGCTFIHYGNQAGYWTTPTAWGEGCSSGSKSYFKNCYFKANGATPAYLCHNNVNFTKPSLHEFDNCQFDAPNASCSFILQSLGSTKKDKVVFKGCRLDKQLRIGETIAGVGNDFVVEGYGNTIIPHDIVLQNGNANAYTNFSDENIRKTNLSASIIVKGKPCKSSGVGGVVPMATSDSVVLFVGASQHDIAIGTIGVLKNRGYVKLTDIGLTANLGDKISISNGSWVVVTSGDYVGVITIAGYMLLK